MADRNTWPAGSDGRQIHELCISSSTNQRRMRSVHSNVVGVGRNHRYVACLRTFSGWCNLLGYLSFSFLDVDH